MINLGISTACFYPFETEASLELIGKNGVKTTEIFFNSLGELKSSFIKDLLQIKNAYDIEIVSIHPTFSLAESFMLFSGYERRYYEGLELYKRYAEIAAELGAKYVVMHGGKPNDVLDDLGFCERFAGIAEHVKTNGAVLLQENVAKYRAGNLETLMQMKNTLGEYANFCLDVKQCIRGGYSPLDALELLNDNIRHIHISDNNSAFDCLLPLKGNYDLIAFLEKANSLNYDGAALIEVYKNAYEDRKEVFESYYSFKNILNKNCLEK